MPVKTCKIYKRPLGFNEGEWFTLTTYNVVRQFSAVDNDTRRTILRGVDLATAKAHTEGAESSSETCKKAHNKRRTRLCGPWADHYYVDRVQYIRKTH